MGRDQILGLRGFWDRFPGCESRLTESKVVTATLNGPGGDAERGGGRDRRARPGAARRVIPEPSTLNPQPSTLNPQPSTLNPQPSTLNPQPSILNPES
jgi:hypothetical protein